MDDDGELVRLKITVLNQTKKITFKTKEGESLTVYARVVEERESKGGKLVEVSRNFYARCTQTNDVFYFGEDVDIYDEDGVMIVSHDGAWLAGKNGALPGVIMPGRFLLGSRYFQELAPGVALDRAEHVKMGFTVHAAGTTSRTASRSGKRRHSSPASASSATAPRPGSSRTAS